MKNRNNNSKHIDILRNQDVRTTNELSGMAEKFMRNRTAYLSVLAGVSIVTFGQAQNVLANDTDKEFKIPPRVAQRAAAVVADLNQRCTTPDLLKRQTNFRLPHQEWKYDLVSAFVGGDNCPGATVPPGTYTTGTPYTDSGSTVGANNTVTSIQTGCSNYTTVAGPDHIYAFKISALGTAPTISMTTSTGTYDPAIYILNGATGAMCPAGTANAVTNCLKGADVGLAGAGETITTAQINTLPLNTQLYLFVDSFYSTAAGSGNYTVNFSDMTVVGNAPVQHIDDFNGDGRSDYAVTRTAGSQITWYIYNATVPEPGGTTYQAFGQTGDILVPVDFDGDGRSDIAVWRPGAPGAAGFYILQSMTSTVRFDNFGQTGDDPTVSRDYDGDGKADPAVWRSGAQAYFYYRKSGPGTFQNQIIYEPWGQTGDFPQPGDYDGDGKADFVVQRNQGGAGLFFRRFATGAVDTVYFGLSSDIITPADFDGDGKTDLSIARAVGGGRDWYYKPSSAPAEAFRFLGTFGLSSDTRAVGDYDGDGRADIAVWRAGTDTTTFFYVLGSTSGYRQQEWGNSGDRVVATYQQH